MPNGRTGEKVEEGKRNGLRKKNLSWLKWIRPARHDKVAEPGAI